MNSYQPMVVSQPSDPLIAVITYGTYLIITLSVTIWVGGTLYKNGRAFLVDAFGGNSRLADSVNHLLLVGFYLINIGYVSMALRMRIRPHDLQSAIELLSGKLGTVLLVLGIMHFFNIYLFSRFRRSALLSEMLPPVSADEIGALER